jgi:hypothetical protein
MIIRDEIKGLWGAISDLNWRLTKARAGLVPTTDPSQIAFMDHFSDASIFWGYRLINTSAAKTILEPAGTLLNFQINAGTSGDWSNVNDLSPHTATGMPGWPCEIIAKVSAFSESGLSHIGIYVGQTPGVAADRAVLFGCVGPGKTIIVSPLGAGAMNLMAYASYPLWLKIRMTSNWNYGYVATFFFSSDGVVWTQYENPAGTPYVYSTGFLTYSGCVGMFAKSWSTFPLTTCSFDYFQMVRSFGPGGS